MGTLIRALIYGEFDVYYRFEWPRGCTLRGLLFASWKYKKARTVVGTTPRHFWLDFSMDLDLARRSLTLLHDASVEGLKRPDIVGIELRERIDLLSRDVQRGL